MNRVFLLFSEGFPDLGSPVLADKGIALPTRKDPPLAYANALAPGASGNASDHTIMHYPVITAVFSR